MASFFRWRIANKVIPILVKSSTNEKPFKSSLLSSIVKVCKLRGEPPQLFIPWKRITDLSQTDNIRNPVDLVTRLRNQGLPTSEGFTDITLSQEPLGVLFTVDRHVFSKIVLSDICSDEENIIRNSCLFQDIPRKNILLQCKVPNIAEIFQMTHFRSAIHCNFIANVNKLVGHNVIKLRHVADGGLKSAILMTGYKEFGIETELLKNPSQHLSVVLKAATEQYVNDLSFKNKVGLCFENMEKGDKAILSDLLYLTKLSLKQHETIYNHLLVVMFVLGNTFLCECFDVLYLPSMFTIGLTFDDSHFDSSYSSEIKEIRKDLLKRNIISVQEGEKLKFHITTESGDENSVNYKDVDSFLFNLSRAIFSCINTKDRHNFDALIYVAPATDKRFFSLLPALIKELGFEWSECLRHIELKEISHFERHKKYFDADSVLKQAKSGILNKFQVELNLEIDDTLEKIADILSLTSLVIHDMNHRRKVDYGFDWKDVLSFGRNSGASLQYCHAGLKGIQGDTEYYFKNDIDTSPLLEKEAHDLIQHLARFDEMVYKSYSLLEPCIILQYLFTLWYLTDRATNILKVDIKSNRLIVVKARLMLLSATMKILQQGLHLLGLTPFETNYTKPDFIK